MGLGQKLKSGFRKLGEKFKNNIVPLGKKAFEITKDIGNSLKPIGKQALEIALPAIIGATVNSAGQAINNRFNQNTLTDNIIRQIPARVEHSLDYQRLVGTAPPIRQQQTIQRTTRPQVARPQVPRINRGRGRG